MKVLTAHSRHGQGTWWSSIISGRISSRCARQLVEALSIVDGWRAIEAERRLEMHSHAVWHVCQIDHIDAVGRAGGLGRHRRLLHETDEASSVAIDGLVDPITDRNRRTSVSVSRINIAFVQGLERVSDRVVDALERCCRGGADGQEGQRG